MPSNKADKGLKPNHENEITRRDALKTAAAVGTTAAIASSLPFNSTLAATPQKGGHLKMGIADAHSTDSLDPTTYGTTYLYLAGYYWGNALVRLDDSMNLVPELAESWDTDDGKKWVFKLRKGVEFHNGKSLTADDVVWSVNRHRVEGAASGLRAFMGQMTEFKATGSHEIMFELENPNADWPYGFTDYHLQIHAEGAPAEKGIGTGPYIVESFDPGVRLLMKRNPNYWKSDAAYFDSLEAIGINDPTARVSALQTGDVEFINDIAPKVANLLERQFTVNRVDSTWFNEFVVLTDTAPFDDNNMRLALKYAIDREEMLAKSKAGAGSVGNDHPIPKSFRFHASDLPQKVYDPDKAKFYYKKTGHSGKLPPLHTANAAIPGVGIEMAELYQQQAARAGIDFDVQRAPDDGYWSNTWRKVPWCGATWGGRATEDQMLTVQYHSESGFNETRWNRPDVDKLLLQARTELDTAKRRQMYHDLQELVSLEGGATLMTFQHQLFGASKRLAGFYTSPFADGNFVEHMYFTS